MAPLDSFHIVNSEKHTHQKLNLRERIVAAVGFVAPNILARAKQKRVIIIILSFGCLDICRATSGARVKLYLKTKLTVDSLLLPGF